MTGHQLAHAVQVSLLSNPVVNEENESALVFLEASPQTPSLIQ